MLGAPSDVIDAARAHMAGDAGGDFEVFAENWPTLLLFLDLESSWQWLLPAMGAPVRLGLPTTEIEAALRLNAVLKADRPDMYRAIRVMERSALEYLAQGQ